MLVDWFTILAQIINFLILIFLLKRFLYVPIVRAMRERERKIQSLLEDAELSKKEAESEAEVYRQKNLEFEKQRHKLLKQVEDDAEELRKELVQEVRDEADEIKHQWQTAIQQEREAFLHELRKRALDQIYALARRALEDLADSDLEERIRTVFIRRIETLDEEQRQEVARALSEPGQEVVVRSAFEISPEGQADIQRALQPHLPEENSLRFEVDAEVLGGVELKASGYKVAWSLSSYLESLEENLAEALRAQPAG